MGSKVKAKKSRRNKRAIIKKKLAAKDRSKKFIGRLKGVFEIVDDIESPVHPPEPWEYD